MRRHAITTHALRLVLALAAAATGAGAQQNIYSAAGTNAAAIQATVDAFRAAIGGGAVAGANGSFGGVRREINWDGVPDAFAAPNALPGDFFNVNSPRGVVLSTPGTGLAVSADASNPTGTAAQFGNIDPNYPIFFEPFSPERLFTAIGSNVVDVAFFVPGTTTATTIHAFGVVFSDADVAGSTTLQFFDALNASLGSFAAPNVAGNQTFSFLGLEFTGGQRASRVRITSGDQTLSPGNTASDLAVMDDFIYSEPLSAQVVPEPATLALLATGLVGVGAIARRTGRRRTA
jgi:hypothetical protein